MSKRSSDFETPYAKRQKLDDLGSGAHHQQMMMHNMGYVPANLTPQQMQQMQMQMQMQMQQMRQMQQMYQMGAQPYGGAAAGQMMYPGMVPAQGPYNQQQMTKWNQEINQLVQRKRYHDAKMKYAEMTRMGVAPNKVTFNTMIKCHYMEGDVPAAIRRFELMKQTPGIAPDQITYNTMVAMFSKKCMIEHALSMVDEMRRAGIAPTERTYNTLIALYSRVDDVPKALATYEEMKALNFKPDDVTFHTLIGTFTKKGDDVQALQMFDSMKYHFIRPDDKIYASLIDMFEKLDNFDKAKEMYEESKKAGLTPNNQTYNALLCMWCKKGDAERANATMDDIKKLGMKADERAQLLYADLLAGKSYNPATAKPAFQTSGPAAAAAAAPAEPSGPISAENVINTV